MWEEISIDSGGFSEINSPESSSDDDSDHVEVAEEDVNVIRGAEPYRFEPLVRPRRVVEQDARDDDRSTTSRQQRSFDATIVRNLNIFNESPIAKCFVHTYIVFKSYFRNKLTPKRINSEQSIPLFISLFNCLNLPVHV